MYNMIKFQNLLKTEVYMKASKRELHNLSQHNLSLPKTDQWEFIIIQVTEWKLSNMYTRNQ